MQLGTGGMINSAKHIYNTEGIRAFYLSFPTTLTMSIPFQMIQFTTYEYARKRINSSGEYSPLSHCISGGIAGACASLVTNPLDVAKTALQTRGLASDTALRHVSGLKDTFKLLYKRHGIAWCTRGVQARILTHVPSTAVSWTVYEFLKFTFVGKT